MRGIIIFIFVLLFSINSYAINEPQISLRASNFNEFKTEVQKCIKGKIEIFEIIYTGNAEILTLLKTGNPYADYYFSPKLQGIIESWYDYNEYEIYQLDNIWNTMKMKDADSDYNDKHLHMLIGANYYMNAKQSNEAEIALDVMCKNLEPKMKGKSEYGKIKLIYQTVMNKIKYDHIDFTSYSIYGALFHERAVCMGYGLLFKRICNYYKIPCKIIVGDCLASNRDARHMWNLVQLKGIWYHVDATWDDDVKKWEFFLKSDEFMASKKGGIRQWEKEYPKCTKNYRGATR